MIPGNRPEDEVFDQWIEGDIGSLLAGLASASLPDLTDCPTCRGVGQVAALDPARDDHNDVILVECDRCKGSRTIEWPPFDVREAILSALMLVSTRLSVHHHEPPTNKGDQ
jgi:hypothetical protein